MLSQVKRKQKLLLALTLTVLITGSILAFSIQAAYSTKNYNSSISNTKLAASQLRADLLDLKSNFGVYLEGNNVESYIDIMVMELDEVQTGLDEMDGFYYTLDAELQSLKRAHISTTFDTAVEPTTDTSEAINSIPAGKTGISLPEWTKKNAGWWADGLISDKDYVIGLEWMINNGVIQIDLEKEFGISGGAGSDTLTGDED